MSGTPTHTPKTAMPKWRERWRVWIRTAETAIVIGLWGGGIASIEDPVVASLLFGGGAVIGSISIFAIPTLSTLAKCFGTLTVIVFFVLSGVFVFFHQVKGVADTASAQLAQIEQADGSRIEFTDIEPFYPPNANSSDPFMFKLSYKNTGSLSAEIPNIRSVVLLPSTWKKHSSQAEYSSNEDELMATLIESAQKGTFSDSGNQIQPGDTDFFEIGPKVSKEDYLKLQQGKYPIGFGFVLKYRDTATPPGYANYTYFCAYLINSGSGGWSFCHSYNKIFVAKN